MANQPSGNIEKKLHPWKFKPRWRISGCLGTRSPLHIGSGDTTTHPDLEYEGKQVEATAHVADFEGLPYLPGSTLKGCIRDWMEGRIQDNADMQDLLDTLMGKDADGEQKDGRGGSAEFHDARLAVSRKDNTPLPYWNSERQTWIETANSIDRHSGTAADGHLIHTECVAAGVSFQLVVTGCFDGEQAACLLAALDGFNNETAPLLLGADTGNGKGRMRWTREEIRCMDKDAAREWVNKQARQMAENELPPLQGEALTKLQTEIEKYKKQFAPQGELLHVPLTLHFDSHFLVNDPLRLWEIEANKKAEDKDKKPNHRPRTDEMGAPLLPAKSFRGAFRSQAERIVRTLGKYACDPADTESKCCKVEDEKKRCLICRIFGATGQKSPVQISDFRLASDTKPDEQIQEFLAIDRFTGGGKGGAKFKAKAVYQPTMQGQITIDPKRLPQEGLAVLALTLRDLQEGDIAFGFGASKGYGTCTAEIEIMQDAKFQKDAKESLKILHN